MSVINQMLKDLEQRRAQGFDNGSGMLEDLDASADENNPPSSSSKKIWWLMFGLLFVVLAGVGFFFSQTWQQKNTTNNLVEAPQVKTPVVVATPKPEPISAPVINDIELEEPEQIKTTPVVPIITAQPQQDEKVKTTKVEQVKEEIIISDVSPSPLTATGLRETITVRGSGFVAPIKITMEWDEGRAFKELEAWQIEIISQTEMQLRVNFGLSADEWRMIIEQADNAKRVEYEFSVAAIENSPAKVKLQETEKKSAFNKKPTQLTTQEKVRLSYVEANYLLQQGNANKAKDVLQEILLLDANHIQARETLAGLLFREKKYVEANSVLEKGLALQPTQVSFILLSAQIYTEQGQDPLAIKMLERFQPAVVANSDYYALLAALYQRGAKYKEATVVYKKLLSVYPGKAVWWMGLGLSLQATAHKQDALQAYQNALSAQGLTEELRRFIQSQMRVLQ